MMIENPRIRFDSIGKRAFSYISPELWNVIPVMIKRCLNTDLFKKTEDIYVAVYSRTSISGGARDGEHSDTSPFPGYTCAKMTKYFRIFLPFSRTSYENSLFNGFIP